MGPTPRSLSLDSALYRYVVEHSSREPPVLARLRAATAGVRGAQMQIGPDQGQFMQFLVRLTGAQRCLELGTYTGYSSLAVALALPADGHLVTCDVSDEWTQLARQFWREAGVENRIDLRLQPALATLDEFAADGTGGFDFAFIDADKTNYIAYYERVLNLLRPGGLICADNTLWSGDVARPEVDDEDTRAIRAFNDHLHRDERIDLSLVPIGDGLTLARKR
ncbi:MAG: class I SAM-dependent methyltransferase [Gammaproteobacteria bacterium]|nr:MAG: class I SAM-dependent methyltransferase [Gammaproteobacteria bacterium]